jgi:hypothetical protein
MVLTSALGQRDGGPAMSGFFGFGTMGGVAGLLLGAGLALRFGGSPGWSRGLMIAGGAVLAFAAILLVASLPDSRSAYSHVIEFQLEYPAAALSGVDIPSSNAMWGSAAGDADEKPISQFFEKNCSDDVCILNGSVAALGPMNNFRIVTVLGSRRHRHSLDVPAVARPMDWSEWRNEDGARVRWRIVKR